MLIVSSALSNIKPKAKAKKQRARKVKAKKSQTYADKLPPIPQRNFLIKWIKRLLMLFVATFVGFNTLVFILLLIWKTHPIHNSMFMVLHRIQNLESVDQVWVDSNKISVYAKQAVIASEDAKFVQHNGFDFKGIETAAKKNEKTGKIKAGGSTISQQLAKNLFLFPQRSYLRKMEEAVITIMLELLWDKQRILIAYLNVVEFGNGIYGIESASQHYFGKSAKNLTRQQSAILIAMLNNPKYYEKNRNSRHLSKKTQVILQRMDSASLPK